MPFSVALLLCAKPVRAKAIRNVDISKAIFIDCAKLTNEFYNQLFIDK